MKMDKNTLENLAYFICGDGGDHPAYRVRRSIEDFFASAGFPDLVVSQDISRQNWVFSTLDDFIEGEINQVLKRLASPKEYNGDRDTINKAIIQLNKILEAEEIEIKIVGVEPVITKINSDFSHDGSTNKDANIDSLPDPNFKGLDLESRVADLLQERWEESKRCMNAEAYLSSIIIMGSILEALFLGMCQSRPAEVNMSHKALRIIKQIKQKNSSTGVYLK